jgi:hypothetical protein
MDHDEHLLYEDIDDFADMPLAFPNDAAVIAQNILSPNINPTSPNSNSSSSEAYFIQLPSNIKPQTHNFSQFGSSSNGETDLRDMKVEVELQEYLFNRLQWYYVTCRFTDNDVSSRTQSKFSNSRQI